MRNGERISLVTQNRFNIEANSYFTQYIPLPQPLQK